MRYCPRTAPGWGTPPQEYELAEQCRRQYRKGDALCDSCPLAEEFGVVDAATPKQEVKHEQGRLW